MYSDQLARAMVLSEITFGTFLTVLLLRLLIILYFKKICGQDLLLTLPLAFFVLELLRRLKLFDVGKGEFTARLTFFLFYSSGVSIGIYLLILLFLCGGKEDENKG